MKRSIGPKPLVYPLPAFLVGAYLADGKANIMTVAWGGICCSEPPLLAVSIRKERATYQAILDRKCFTVNIPRATMAAETDFAGIASGNKTDKFAELNLTAIKGEFVDAPFVKECPVVLEMALHSYTDLGSHTQFIGEIKDVKVDDNCLDESGNPVISRTNPLFYDGGGREYFQAGAPIGKAFSGGKIFRQKNNR